MAKPAGGPKPRDAQAPDLDDWNFWLSIYTIRN
jgi:hypothetical protein